MTVSLRLSGDLSRKLAALAKARNTSKSALIRECLSAYLAGEEEKRSAWELGKDLFGCFDSGRGDLSIRAKEIARQRAHGKRAKKRRR